MSSVESRLSAAGHPRPPPPHAPPPPKPFDPPRPPG